MFEYLSPTAYDEDVQVRSYSQSTNQAWCYRRCRVTLDETEAICATGIDRTTSPAVTGEIQRLPTWSSSLDDPIVVVDNAFVDHYINEFCALKQSVELACC